MMERFYENAVVLEEKDALLETEEVQSRLLEKIQSIFEQEISSLKLHSHYSDLSVYTGLYGRLSSLWKVANELNELFGNEKGFLTEIARKLYPSRQLQLSGYYGTDTGIIVTRIMMEEEMEALKLAEDFLVQVKTQMSQICSSLPCEVLYGKSGLLCGLLMIYNKLTKYDYISNEISEFARIISKSILLDSFSFGNLRHCWSWHGKEYLGAIHGVIGIYAVLIAIGKTFQIDEIPIDDLVKDLAAVISDYSIGISLKSTPNDILADKVQFCHGLPGLAIAICEISCFIPDILNGYFTEYLLKASDFIYKFGLLRKGFSLCHGISGNGYVFLQLFDTCNNNLYFQRALYFANCVLEKDSDKAKELFSKPDHPHSLMEGNCGVLRFLLDVYIVNREIIQNGSRPEVHFPSFFHI